MALKTTEVPLKAIQSGCEALGDLPAMRVAGEVASPSQLKSILDILNAYIAAPSTKAYSYYRS